MSKCEEHDNRAEISRRSVKSLNRSFLSKRMSAEICAQNSTTLAGKEGSILFFVVVLENIVYDYSQFRTFCVFEWMFRSSQIVSIIMYRYANTNTTNGLLWCQQFAFSHHRFVFVFLFPPLFLSLSCFRISSLPYWLSLIQNDEILHVRESFFREKRPQNASITWKGSFIKREEATQIFSKNIIIEVLESCDAIKSIHIYSARWHTSL